MGRDAMGVRKSLYVALGCLGVALGAAAAFVPVLPSFPFVALAVFCFARSSDRLHRWIVGTKLYRDNLESFVRTRGMTRRTKVRILTISAAAMAISGAVFLRDVPVALACLAILFACQLAYFMKGIKTLDEPACADKRARRGAFGRPISEE